MTVQSTITSKTFYPGGALASQSLAGLVFFAADDVRVEVLDADGVPGTLLARDEDYTLTGDGATGTASITPTAVWADDVRWYVSRSTTPVQPEAFPVQQPLSSAAVERGLNRAALIAQEQSDALARAPLVLPGQTPPMFNVGGISAGQVLALVGDKIQGVNNDPASAADSAAMALVAKDETIAMKSSVDSSRQIVETAAELVQDYGGAPVYTSWPALNAVVGAADAVAVVPLGTGTHTDPVVGGTVNDQGLYAWSVAPAGWQRVGDTSEVRARQQVALAQVAASAAAANALQGRLRVDDATTYISVSPSSAWNGTAGTGFSSTPADPARTTAKPAVRLIVPPNQAFTDYLVIGVAAWANNGGSFDNCGLQSVKFHYEGSTATVSRPSFYSFPDANGNTVTYFGWWCVLLHNGTNGDANLYVEATPKDTSMQNRVVGPYLFLPRATLYDLDLEVAPSQSVVAGARYQSITAALSYCANQAKHHPRIRITEARNDYVIGTISSPSLYTAGKGYCTIEATVPITIIGTTTYADATFRPKYSGLRFKGSNITFDYANADRLFHEGTGNQYWWDGVRIRSSTGRAAMMASLGGPKPVGFSGGQPWITECVVSDLPIPAMRVNLARGTLFSSSYSDAIGEALCVISCRFDDFDPYIDWSIDINALTVSYTGPGTTATLELSGGNNASSRTFTARVDGAAVGTFTTDRFYTVGTGRNSSVVAWLNGLSGWSATLQEDTRRASVLGIVGGTGGAFSARNCKSVTLQLVTHFDYHGDFYQQNSPATSTTENVIVAHNVVTKFAGQCFFISSSSVARDFVFLNNCFHGKAAFGAYYNPGNFFSQIDRSGAKSHLVFAHNSSTQGFYIRTTGGWTADAYCLFAGNVFRTLEWLNTPNANMRLDGNHLFGGATTPSGSIATTTGGTDTDLFQSVSTGDFTPKGALLNNLKVPVIRRDLQGRVRARMEAAGAAV